MASSVCRCLSWPAYCRYKDSKHAEFLHNEVPGITLSDEARERMRMAGPDGRSRRRQNGAGTAAGAASARAGGLPDAIFRSI